MRVKDWLSGLYVFGGRPPGPVDLCFFQRDILTQVRYIEARDVLQLVDNYTAALWFFYERADAATKDAFHERISETGDPAMSGNPIFRSKP